MPVKELVEANVGAREAGVGCEVIKPCATGFNEGDCDGFWLIVVFIVVLVQSPNLHSPPLQFMPGLQQSESIEHPYTFG